MPRELVPVPSGEPKTAGELLALLNAMNTNISKRFAGCTCSKEANRVVGGFQIRHEEIERTFLLGLEARDVETVPLGAPVSEEVQVLVRLHKRLYERLIDLYREPGATPTA